jgi:hypothetical protein
VSVPDGGLAWSRAGLEARGFVGYLDALSADLGLLPAAPGVYVLLARGEPTFLERSLAGQFRGDPSVSVDRLRAEWVMGAELVYIGKATNLRRRVRQYLSHGRGGSGRHWGGRFVWQATFDELLLAWRAGPSPRETEKQLIREFVAAHGRRPFANLVG